MREDYVWFSYGNLQRVSVIRYESESKSNWLMRLLPNDGVVTNFLALFQYKLGIGMTMIEVEGIGRLQCECAVMLRKVSALYFKRNFMMPMPCSLNINNVMHPIFQTIELQKHQ